MRKRWIFLLIVLSLVLAACAPSAQPTAAPAEETGEPVAREGGTMTGAFDVGPGGYPERFDPWNATAGWYWFEMYFSKLVRYCTVELTEMCGDLAESWEISDDGTVYTFHLRDGVLWHDGEPFTAEDVEFSLRMVATPGVSRWAPNVLGIVGAKAYNAGEADSISGIEVVDDHTIRLTLEQPNAALLDGLAFIVIAPKHHLENIAPEDLPTSEWWRTNPVGTGPFKWVRYEPGQFVELERFEDYWNGAPRLERLINRYFPEAGTAVLALESGEIDFTYITADERGRLEDNPNIEIIPGPSWVNLSIVFDVNSPPFNDVRVRQAFMYAIDRAGIAETLWDGTATVANCYFVAPNLVPDDINPYPYDPDRARELLAEAGWDSESVGELQLLTYYSDPLSLDILAAIQAQLADVGVNIDLRTVDVPTFVDEFYDEEYSWKIAFVGAASGPDPDVVYNLLHTSATWPAGSNIRGYSNPEVDRLLEEGRLEANPQARAQIYQQLCRVLNEEVPNGWMWETIRFGAVNTRIGNFIYTPSPGGGRYLAYPETWFIRE